MDDFNVASLQESKNEWCVRLLNVLQPQINEGVRSIFTSARTLCKDNREPDKYLLTFQNLLTRIPQWNAEIISTETNRIVQSSNCKYLEDLITCVHIIQLKLLTYARVGTKYKKLDIAIPKLNDFIHKVYVNCARVFYQQAFLFKLELPPVDIQKNNVIVSNHIKECIMNSVRDSIPFELMVRTYLDETHETFDEIKEELSVSAPPEPILVDKSITEGGDPSPVLSEVSFPFNDISKPSIPVTKEVDISDGIIGKLSDEISKRKPSSFPLTKSLLEDSITSPDTDEDHSDPIELVPADESLLDCIEL
jgi:hypothetical protein